MNNEGSNNKTNLLESAPLKILGVIADFFGAIGGIVGVITFLLALQIPNSENTVIAFTGLQLNPFHALALWCISAFAYLGFLKNIWQKKQQTHNLQQNFWDSLKSDFVRGFKFPFTTLPGFILIMSLIWIIVEILTWQNAIVFQTVIVPLIFGIFMLGLLGLPAIFIFSDNISDFVKTRKVKKSMSKDWNLWKSRIDKELRRLDKGYLEVSDLKDLADLYDLDVKALKIIFAKYASLHSDKAMYGNVYLQETGEPYFKVPILAKRTAKWNKEYFFK